MKSPEQLAREIEVVAHLGATAGHEERRVAAELLRLALTWVVVRGSERPRHALERLTPK